MRKLLHVTLGIAFAAHAYADSARPAASADNRIRTQLTAQHDVTISSQVEGKIAQLPLKEGDAFKAGQLLVAFDCELYEAQLRKAEAGAEAAQKTYDINKQLSQLQSVGELEVAQALAKAKAADAEMAYMRATVANCRVVAPFAGRIAKRLAAQYEYVSTGKPLLQIVDNESMELKLSVPSLWLAWLRAGAIFQVHVDDLNADYSATVARMGARVDPVSQTVEVSAKIKGNRPELLPGMSGWARFPDRPDVKPR